jgi:Ser/Thr protein kinase RdoA (MazF antagonist)
MERSKRLETLVERWGISDIREWVPIKAKVCGLTLSDGRKYALKEIGEAGEGCLARLRFDRDVLLHAADQGVKVALPLAAMDGEPFAIDSGLAYGLTAWLRNEAAEAPDEAGLVRLYRGYGAAIGGFHRALSGYRDEGLSSRTWRTDLKARILDQALPVVRSRLRGKRLADLDRLFGGIEAGFAAALSGLPEQLVIWDCHPGNVAIQGYEVSGFIDCDHISVTAKIFDLANFLVHLVKWDVGDPQKEAAWLARAGQIIRGYETASSLGAKELAALPYAMAGIPLMFMEYFLPSGDEELVEREYRAFAWLSRRLREIGVLLGAQESLLP